MGVSLRFSAKILLYYGQYMLSLFSRGDDIIFLIISEYTEAEIIRYER